MSSIGPLRSFVQEMTRAGREIWPGRAAMLSEGRKLLTRLDRARRLAAQEFALAQAIPTANTCSTAIRWSVSRW